jgi:phage terminase large subunit-like protein
MSAPIGDLLAIRAAAEELLELPREEFDACMETLDPAAALAISRCWQLHRLPHQRRPVDCRPIWLLMMGRGAGKTRTAAEETLDLCEEWGAQLDGVLISKTIGDVRDVMIKGRSGLLACARARGYSCEYIANQKLVKHPTGAHFKVMTCEEPEESRGHQSNFIWWDEIAACRHTIEIWDNLFQTWRLPVPGGGAPQMILTTTPRPSPIMHRLVMDDIWRPQVTITKGSTFDNQSNLNEMYIAVATAVYTGTTLGRQELMGELLPGKGAIWLAESIHQNRIHHIDHHELDRRIVSLDPSITSKDTSDAAGIIVVGADALDHPHAYVFDDRTLEQAAWPAWGKATILAALEWDCDAIVAETNQGGEGISEQLASSMEECGLTRDAIPIRTVWATKSKRARAEPVGSLYERGRVHHVGDFPQLEREMVSWLPGAPSPNRMDALVHGVTHLLLGERISAGLEAYLT